MYTRQDYLEALKLLDAVIETPLPITDDNDQPLGKASLPPDWTHLAAQAIGLEAGIQSQSVEEQREYIHRTAAIIQASSDLSTWENTNTSYVDGKVKLPSSKLVQATQAHIEKMTDHAFDKDRYARRPYGFVHDAAWKKIYGDKK